MPQGHRVQKVSVTIAAFHMGKEGQRHKHETGVHTTRPKSGMTGGTLLAAVEPSKNS